MTNIITNGSWYMISSQLCKWAWEGDWGGRYPHTCPHVSLCCSTCIPLTLFSSSCSLAILCSLADTGRWALTVGMFVGVPDSCLGWQRWLFFFFFLISATYIVVYSKLSTQYTNYIHLLVPDGREHKSSFACITPHTRVDGFVYYKYVNMCRDECL